MDAYSNLQTQIQQALNLMNRPVPIPQEAPKQATTIKEVDGIVGARIYQKSMAPNSSDAVFDKNEQVFYGLAVDANGNPAPIKRCPFTVEDVPEPGSDAITKGDLEALEQRIMAQIIAYMKKEESE